jgi:hypothetical protein
MKYSNFSGMLAWSGGTTLLRAGDSIDDDHPLLTERPDLFTEDEPEAKRNSGPTVERATAAPGEVRTTPGAGPRGNRVPKPGSAQ